MLQLHPFEDGVGRNGLNVGVGVIFLRSSVLKTPHPMQITEHTRALVHTLYLPCVNVRGLITDRSRTECGIVRSLPLESESEIGRSVALECVVYHQIMP